MTIIENEQSNFSSSEIELNESTDKTVLEIETEGDSNSTMRETMKIPAFPIINYNS